MGEGKDVSTDISIRKSRMKKKKEDYDPDMDKEYMLDSKCCCFIHYKKGAVYIGALDAFFFFVFIGLVAYSKIVVN